MSAPTPRPSPATASGFKGIIGVARADITPPIGIYSRNWGAAKHDCADGIHRPLELSALTLQEKQDSAPLVIVSMDLGWWKDPADELALRNAVLDALKIPRERVLMCLTHTHAGPSVARLDAEKPGGHLITPYFREVIESAVFAARRALANARPGVLEWAHGHCDLAQNRDLPDPEKGGKDARYICGFAHATPDASDTTLLFGRVTDTRGSVMATLVNYACHPTTLAWDNHLISPDFCGAMREVIERETSGAPCLFLQGASGELAPREQYTGDLEIAEKNGRQLGYAALAALQGMLPPATELAFSGAVESGAPLATWQRKAAALSSTLKATCVDVELPLVDMPSIAEIERDLAACNDRVMGERLRRKRGVRQTVGEGKVSRMPLWLWQVGGALLAAQPNEAYSQFQIAVRRKFPDRAVAVMNLVNGSCGYLAPRELYAHNIYQVWQSPFQAGGLELLIQKTIQELEGLSR
ncbi:MAG TPA: neutral/alkaline non-lysosomal ceramidase N-terminal domain-containing protein [Planctomycetota bacterium]|nr:neutral/alkaline non-lysosomal ceramidase N-terminal domain-containing protein [Planctomycetota bacterium]